MRREENQDCFGIIKTDPFQGFFVADGMGGVNGGALASRLAISTLQELLPNLKEQISPDVVRSVVAEINTRIFERGSAQPGLAGMGTTLVGLVFTAGGIISLNVGDSRAYRIRGGSIKQLSEDHTVVSELVKSGAISNQEAEGHPVSHMLTRSLGPLPEVIIESRFELEAPALGDVYVLCSDGLYNFVSNQDILDVIKQNPLDDANQILINLANRRGGTDNITVVIISVGERPAKGRGSDYRLARETPPGRQDLNEEESKATTPVDAQPDLAPPKIPPPVAEPQDAESERERVRNKNRVERVINPRLPGYLKLAAAVVFGLVVGDLGRRSGAFPSVAAFIESTRDSVIGSGGAESSSGLQQISKDLRIPSTTRSNKEGISDIARRVRGQVGSDSDPDESSRSTRDRPAASRKVLESRLARLEGEVSAIGTLSIDEATKNLQSVNSRAEELQGRIDQIEMQIDAASRKLSLWFGRKKRMETNDPDVFQPANDLERVGAASPAVKRKIAECTEASYLLQAKQDEYELYPGNEHLREQVRQLQSSREKLLGELRSEVDKAVNVVLADTNRDLEELKLRRDILLAEFEGVREERDFLKVLANPDSDQRDALKARLERQLDDLRSGLADSAPAQ
jgi:protein phosphatase